MSNRSALHPHNHRMTVSESHDGACRRDVQAASVNRRVTRPQARIYAYRPCECHAGRAMCTPPCISTSSCVSSITSTKEATHKYVSAVSPWKALMGSDVSLFLSRFLHSSAGQLARGQVHGRQLWWKRHEGCALGKWHQGFLCDTHVALGGHMAVILSLGVSVWE